MGYDHTYEALWHINEKDAVIDGTKVVADGVTLFTCGFDSLECFCGSKEPFQGWLSRACEQCADYPAPALVAKRKGKDVSFATLIAVGTPEKIAVSGVSLDGNLLIVRYGSGNTDSVDLAALRAKIK
jgi:hypothetical protein